LTALPFACQKTALHANLRLTTIFSLAEPGRSLHQCSMPANEFAATPTPPYYAVIFTSQRTAGDHGYDAMAEKMLALAARQPGFLGAESVRSADGLGLTVSYWTDALAIAKWKANADHQVAQQAGKQSWYARYAVRVARVERVYGKF
jgi:heme-degrading monooxygenase HmoA